jgi:hypothetical protein
VSRQHHCIRLLQLVKKLAAEVEREAAHPPSDPVNGSEAVVLAEQATMLLRWRRPHVVLCGDESGKYLFDPRMLLFEYTTTFVLRPPQVTAPLMTTDDLV